MKESLLKIRHDRSVKEYPHLGLTDGEFVQLEFRRAAICHVLIWVIAASAAVLLSVALLIFNASPGTTVLSTTGDARGFINLVGIVFYGVIALIGIVTTHVFSGNRLYVTNRRAIQYDMVSLFANSVNIIELNKIEDISFRQTTVFQHIFGIGTIRMSTVGDETTYTFKYAYKPTAGEIQSLTDLVANAKKLID